MCAAPSEDIMARRNPFARVVLLALVLATGWSCNGILDNEPRYLDPALGQGGHEAGGADSSGPAGRSATSGGDAGDAGDSEIAGEGGAAGAVSAGGARSTTGGTSSAGGARS